MSSQRPEWLGDTYFYKFVIEPPMRMYSLEVQPFFSYPTLLQK